jgi:hypothetical protein
MKLPHRSALLTALPLSACGAPNARAGHLVDGVPLDPEAAEELAVPAQPFKTICSIARADLTGSVSDPMRDGWRTVNCTMYETQATEHTDSVLGHSSYLAR